MSDPRIPTPSPAPAAGARMRACGLAIDGTDVAPEWLDLPVPQPAPGQVLVRMHAAGLNRG